MKYARMQYFGYVDSNGFPSRHSVGFGQMRRTRPDMMIPGWFADLEVPGITSFSDGIFLKIRVVQSIMHPAGITCTDRGDWVRACSHTVVFVYDEVGWMPSR